MNPDRRAPYPSAAWAWAFVLILFAASIVSVIDRSVLNIVVDSLKADLRVSDVQVSLLQGLAFGLFYAAVGLPLGLTADRYSRRWLIFVGMGLWSCATCAGGFAHGFGSLFLSRTLVGLGEACLSPAAISLIGDLFPPDKRGRPISVFLMGQSLAVGLSISVTGSILHAAQTGWFHAAPLIGALAPWRVVFVLCGLAGPVVLAFLLTVREPVRLTPRRPGNIGAQAVRCISYMTRNAAIFVPFYLGFAFCFMAVYGAGAWTPTMLMRAFGANGAQLAQRLGPLSLGFGVLGPLVGGFVVDRQARRKAYDAKLRTLAFAPLFAIPSVLAAFAPSLGTAILLVAAIGAVSVFIGAVTIAALQSMVPADMRGIGVALTGLVNTIIGATLGPLLVAELTQRLYHRPALVGYAIATLAAPALLLGGACFGLAFLALRRQIKTGGEVGRAVTM